MTQEKSTSGISFMGLLTILFIGLKLTDYIQWSWLWVLSPLWLGLVGFLSFMAIFVTTMLKRDNK